MTGKRARTAYVIAGLLIASSMPAAQWLAMSDGEPFSLPRGEILWLYWIAPFLVLGVIAASVIAILTLVFGRSLGAYESRRGARAWVFPIAVVALAMWGGSWLSSRVRMARLERRAEALTTDAVAYLAGQRETPPALRIRGCSELTATRNGLRATCQRGFAQWDELIFDPAQHYESADVVILGAWAYRWD